MNTEIISTGSELLYGKVLDTNAKFLADNLTKLGYNVTGIHICGDTKETIGKNIRQSMKEAQLLIITGGLGPTDDDLTRDALSDSLNLKLEIDNNLKEQLEKMYFSREIHMANNNLKQVMLPEGAEAIPNDIGTAPGIKIVKDDIMIIALPGVPVEMKKMFSNKIMPILKNRNPYNFNFEELNFLGIGESNLAEKIAKLSLPDEVMVSYQAGKGQVKLRLKEESNQPKSRQSKLTEAVNMIIDNFEKYYFSKGEEELNKVVAMHLQKSKKTIAVAESCTGGLLSNRLTDIPGSSAYFTGGVTTYTNESKQQLLQVSKDIIEKHGAVSPETATAMADGVKKLFKADFGLATTGVAGPETSEGKPVGLIYLGLATPTEIKTYCLKIDYGREMNKWVASQYALYYLLRHLWQRGGILK